MSCTTDSSETLTKDEIVGPMTIGDENAVANETKPSRKRPEYNPKKPKWWVKLCGRPTKAQKRATIELFKTHRLPTLKYGESLDWSTLFPKDKDIWLELGCGRGENLLALAHRRRNDNLVFVGMELHKTGMATICQRILQGKEESKFWTDYTLYSPDLDPYNSCQICQDDNASGSSNDGPSAVPFDNVRLFPGDGIKYMPHLVSDSVAAVLITFPDPFPRDHQKEWRLVQVETLAEIHRVLRKGPNPGKLFLATDHDGYYEWCNDMVEAFNSKEILFKEELPCPDRMDWLPAISRYEQKGWEEGRSTKLRCWTKKSSV